MLTERTTERKIVKKESLTHQHLLAHVVFSTRNFKTILSACDYSRKNRVGRTLPTPSPLRPGQSEPASRAGIRGLISLYLSPIPTPCSLCKEVLLHRLAFCPVAGPSFQLPWSCSNPPWLIHFKIPASSHFWKCQEHLATTESIS